MVDSTTVTDATLVKGMAQVREQFSEPYSVWHVAHARTVSVIRKVCGDRYGTFDGPVIGIVWADETGKFVPVDLPHAKAMQIIKRNEVADRLPLADGRVIRRVVRADGDSQSLWVG